jgi:5-methylcytosine-specific restriction protein A
MPWAPLRPCGFPGCPARQDGPYCPAHRRETRSAYDRGRGKTAERGYDARHKRWAAVILARDPICKICDEADSVLADHIVPVRDGGDWSFENGQGVCQECHNKKTARETAARRTGVGGVQIPGADEPATGPRSHVRTREMERKRAL